ncbi:hypothetical protein PsYK624_078780 [Phanerochaete sordida]|uniref:Uncharacterized protein n=1 Tax=Phanerochaete sordida TaxID=48140 RepID=A0A9P3GBS4_9APHY|nr:hypothetical protein PsYK624_078780 [Phanerochaete sordida]
MTMSLELDSIDPLANQGVIAVQWTLLQDSCMVENNNNTSDCPPVNIYMDPTMFSGSGGGPPSGNNSDPQSPVFTIFAEGWNDLFANYPNFETSLNIGTRTDKLVDSLLNYPFDRYIAELWMYATVDGTNNPVNLIIVDASGVAFGFDAMVASIDNSDNQLDVFLNIQRTVLVRAYVVTIILAMWLVTLLLLVIAIKAIFFRGKVDTTILAAPVATLFAFTSLRTAMPGAPSGFGAIIDFVGTLPTLATLITITVVCLLHVLLRSIGDEAKKPSALEA